MLAATKKIITAPHVDTNKTDSNTKNSGKNASITNDPAFSLFSNHISNFNQSYDPKHIISAHGDRFTDYTTPYLFDGMTLNNIEQFQDEPHSSKRFSNITNIPHIIDETSYPNNLKTVWVTRAADNKDVTYLRCKLDNPTNEKPVDQKILEIFNTIRSNNAKELLQRPPYCASSFADAMGKCIYSFGPLNGTFGVIQECACPPLDRKTTSKRQEYEEKVIRKSLDIAKRKKSISITIFASGLLFSELVLLVKLIHQLKNIDWQGKISVNFIDKKYAFTEAQKPLPTRESISKVENQIEKFKYIELIPLILGLIGVYKIAKNKKKLTGGVILGSALALGGFSIFKKNELQNELDKLKKEQLPNEKVKKYSSPIKMKEKETDETRASKAVPEVLKLLKLALPSHINLKARFFCESSDYQNLCQVKDKFKSDILIGSDIDKSQQNIENLRTNTQNQGGSGVVLTNSPEFIEWVGNPL